MSQRDGWCSVICRLLFTAGLLMGGQVAAAEPDVAAVKQAAAGFHKALNVLFVGDAQPMKAVWSHADDITYMGPMGEMHAGWTDIEPIWDAQAALMLGGKIEMEKLHVTAGPEVGVASYYEQGENMVNGKPQKVSIRCTTSFRKEAGVWKVIGHHTDKLTFLAE